MGDEHDPASVVRRHWAAWRYQDKQTSLTLCAPDVTFAVYVPEHVLFFGGETTGKPSVSDRLQTLIDHFETIDYEGTVTRVTGNVVHGLVRFRFRHRATGEEIEGVMRQVVVVRNGLMQRLEEYHDAARIRAFMRLVAQIARDGR